MQFCVDGALQKKRGVISKSDMSSLGNQHGGNFFI